MRSAERRALDYLRIEVSSRLELWKKKVIAEHFTGRFTPALDKRGLQLLNGRTFDSGIGVAPVAAGKADSTVDNEYAAMIAIIVIQQLPWRDELK